ncbi:MAG: sigma-70 family RNA polymerase sigma factor [Planctomycetota bacterium]
MINQPFEPELTDELLIKEYKNNNTGSLQKLLLRYHKQLFNFIYRMTKNTALSEDILQEVFLRVIKNIKRFVPERESSFRQWLYQIAINLCRDNFKRRQEFSSMGLESISKLPQTNPYEIEDLIAGLPKEQKEVVLLKVYSGLTFREIADTLKCPINTAISRMHYALKSLRGKMKIYDSV